MDLMAAGSSVRNAQIALEFIVVYSFVLIVFLVFFALIVTQRANTLSAQGYSEIQLIAQNVASYLDQAVYSGSGYNVTVPLVGSIGVIPYNLSISTTGVVVASIKVGDQVTTVEAFSAARDMVVNGTESPLSANGIYIYSVQTNGGSLTLHNQGGTIYVDESPPQVGNLTGSVAFSTFQATNTTNFDLSSNANAFIDIPSSPSLYISPANTGLTISLWFDSIAPQSSYVSVPLVSTAKGSSVCGYRLLFPDTKDIRLADICGHSVQVAYSLNPNTWYNLIATLTPENALGLTGTFYIDGQPIGSKVAATWNSLNTWSDLYIGFAPGVGVFPGLITNMQIYNTTLNSTDAKSIYYAGIGGAPISSQGLVAWYRLNGNTFDYSGNGNTGAPTNVIYNTTLQADITAHSMDMGYAPQGSLIGVASSAGVLGNTLQSPNTITLYANASGSNTIFLTEPETNSVINIDSTAYEGSAADMTSLVGWWPLNEGFGSYAHDFSGFYNGGEMVGMSWAHVINASNFRPALFGVASSGGVTGTVSINASNTYNEIVQNNSFTAVAWVYYKGTRPSPSCQGIFGDASQTMTSGFGMYAEACAPLVVGGSSLSWPAGSGTQIPTNSWEMVTGQYSGISGVEDFWLNDTLFASNSGVGARQLPQTANFFIGDLPPATGDGGVVFNGMITNVQLYSSLLTQQQIGLLYSEGATGIPLQNTGLVGWWPLDGTAADYSYNQNSGVVLTKGSYPEFNNVPYGSYPNVGTGSGGWVASFHDTGYVTIPNNAVLNPSSITIAFWMNASSVYGTERMVNKWDSCNDYTSHFISGDQHIYFQTPTATASAYYTPYFNRMAFITFTDSGSTQAIYIDGRLVDAVSAGGGLPTTCTNNLDISNPSYPFNGFITDVQIYNSVLSQAEISQLYAMGVPQGAYMNVTNV